MARRSKRYHKKTEGYIELDWTMINSPEYRDLNHSAKALLPIFVGKAKKALRFLRSATFEFPYPEAEKHGFPRATFSRAIKSLQRSGFIKISQYGGLKSLGGSTTKFDSRTTATWISKQGIQEWEAKMQKNRAQFESRTGSQTGLEATESGICQGSK